MRWLLALCLLAGCGVAPSRSTEQTGTPESKPPAKPTGVLGVLDAVDAQGVVGGWALVRSEPTRAVEVAFFADGDELTGTPVGTTPAALPRPDVNAATRVAGDHGFSFALPTELKDGKPHTLRAYGSGPGGKVELGGSPRDFTVTVTVAPCATAGPLATPDPEETVINLQADNGKFVAAECGGDDVGALHANRDAAAEWELFYVRAQPNGKVSIRSSHGRYLSAKDGGGGPLEARRTAALPWELFTLVGNLREGALISLKTADDVHYVTARLDKTPPVLEATAKVLDVWERFKVHVVFAPVKSRKGIVRAEGRSFVDDEGPFFPLGGTLFWAVSGWKFEKERVKQNLKFLGQHRFDYVRILGEVDWAGRPIDPNWPDYPQLLAEVIDYAYDECGLRTELTLIGGAGDAMAVAQKAVAVINAGRQHKILNLEVANESYQRPISLATMRAVGRYLRQSTPNLVALSSGEGLGSYVPNTTNWRADYVATYMQPDTANLGTIHMDRGYGDLGWRTARQPWDWKDFPFPISHNEPIGPRSSVAEEVDPIRLTMIRAVGLINGVGAFVLHNGAGVTGAVDPARNRPANLWEVPGIDAIMDALRGIDAFVPARAGEGSHWNNGWAGAPWNADAFWADGADHGVNRNYSVSTPDGWVSTEAGVKDHVVMTATRHSVVEVFDVLKGKVKDVELQAGQTLTLTPDSKDSNGLGAFIVVGHYK